MNVLLISAFVPEVRFAGGVVRHLSLLRRHLRRRGCRVHVLASRPSGDTVPDVGDTTLVRPPLQGRSRVPLRFHVAMVRRYREVRRTFDPDVVHVHSSAGALVRRWECSVPVVTTVHSLPIPGHGAGGVGLGRRLLSSLHGLATRSELGCVWRFSDRIVVVSPKVLVDAGRYLRRTDRSRVVHIPPGLDLETFRPVAREQARRAIGWGAEPVLLYVGRLTSGKRVGQLLEILAAVRERLGDTRAVVVGEGPELDNLRRRAASLGVAGATVFAGSVPHEQLVAFYNAADVFVNPTGENETFGMALGEAMACGTPVLASTEAATTGVAPLEGVSIYGTVSEGSALAERLLRDGAARRRSSDHGRNHVERYGAERTASEVLGVYEDVVSEGRRPVPPFLAGVPGFVAARVLETGLARLPRFSRVGGRVRRSQRWSARSVVEGYHGDGSRETR